MPRNYHYGVGRREREREKEKAYQAGRHRPRLAARPSASLGDGKNPPRDFLQRNARNQQCRRKLVRGTIVLYVVMTDVKSGVTV